MFMYADDAVGDSSFSNTVKSRRHGSKLARAASKVQKEERGDGEGEGEGWERDRDGERTL